MPDILRGIRHQRFCFGLLLFPHGQDKRMPVQRW